MVELRNKKNIDNSKPLSKRKYNKKKQNVSKAVSPQTTPKASSPQTTPKASSPQTILKASSPKSSSIDESQPLDLRLDHSRIDHQPSFNFGNNSAEMLSGKSIHVSAEMLSEKSNHESPTHSNQKKSKKGNVFVNKAFFKRKIYSTYVNTFENTASLDLFLRQKHKFAMMITHSNEVKCTLCNNVDEHKMVTQYRSCQCGYSGCNFGYKCNRLFKWHFLRKSNTPKKIVLSKGPEIFFCPKY